MGNSEYKICSLTYDSRQIKKKECVLLLPLLFFLCLLGVHAFVSLYGKVAVFVVCCLTLKQHASVSQGLICSDNCKCYHIETEVEGQTFYLTQSWCIDTGPTGPSADPILPGAWQGSHWTAKFKSLVRLDLEKDPWRKRESNPGLPLSRRTSLPLGQRGSARSGHAHACFNYFCLLCC